MDILNNIRRYAPYDKINKLITLIDNGFNVFKFGVPETYLHFISMINLPCSIRLTLTEQVDSLPFIYMDKAYCESNGDPEKKLHDINEIWNISQKTRGKLIVAYGAEYAEFQQYNAVIDFKYPNKKMDFLLEISYSMSPLREIYDKGFISLKGNMFDDKLEIVGNSLPNKALFSKRDVYSILDNIILHYPKINIFNRRFELTKYSKKVGILNSNFIYWEM